MSSAKAGDTVHVHYTGRLEDGGVFDTSEGKAPLQFVLGTGAVIPGVEKAVDGLTVGESISTEIAPQEGYGLRSEELLFNVPRDNFPDGVTPQVGQRFAMTSDDGQQTPVTVTTVGDDTVQIDANHPLAGKSLHFELKLIKID